MSADIDGCCSSLIIQKNTAGSLAVFFKFARDSLINVRRCGRLGKASIISQRHPCNDATGCASVSE
jgi:hypothetical protein